MFGQRLLSSTYVDLFGLPEPIRGAQADLYEFISSSNRPAPLTANRSRRWHGYVGYTAEISRYCPLAQVVYDLFHVVAKYAHENIDWLRVDAANSLRGDTEGRAFVNAARWLLLRNRESITHETD